MGSEVIAAALTLILSLAVTPLAGFGRWAEFQLEARLSSPAWVCTGWRYRVAQWRQDEWPQRRSCRQAGPVIREYWGGGKYPLPFVGEYEAFIEIGNTREVRKFWVQD